MGDTTEFVFYNHRRAFGRKKGCREERRQLQRHIGAACVSSVSCAVRMPRPYQMSSSVISWNWSFLPLIHKGRLYETVLGILQGMESAGKKTTCYFTQAKGAGEHSKSLSKSLLGTRALLAALVSVVDQFIPLTPWRREMAYGNGRSPQLGGTVTLWSPRFMCSLSRFFLRRAVEQGSAWRMIIFYSEWICLLGKKQKGGEGERAKQQECVHAPMSIGGHLLCRNSIY